MGIKRLGADGRAPHGEWAGGQATEQAMGQAAGHHGAVGAPGGHVLAWELAGDTTAAARARALTRRTLILWRVEDPADVDDVVLMVDELVTNAIVHGTGPVRLRLRLEGRELLAEVGDDSPLVPRPRRADPAAVDWSETGRGLLLVTALAGDHGTRQSGHGKVVWFSRLLRRAGCQDVPAGARDGRQGRQHGAGGQPGDLRAHR
ncbi:Histidine kinase-like ATPase domain-containing protein [Thermomonospora echinospora]|uniref:Histidine kinase-like ATPase domain-containing protein n=1 Tax=Thermomonospora echinospora TaxID=1992 RepID=A0A1H6D8Y3_9ACTN|nr:ATP-binding protein [Thermomonospora echinospora]SEG81628.1 Histidine kinase-like ATPase domain-containing protein [Thermomonospora echinospora]